MTTANLSLEERLESIKDKYPRLYNEHKSFDYIVGLDLVRAKLCDVSRDLGEGMILAIMVHPNPTDEKESTIDVGTVSIAAIQEFYWGSSICEEVARKQCEILSTYLQMLDQGKTDILVFCQWVWSPEEIEIHGSRMSRQPLHHLGTISKPFYWGTVQQSQPSKSKPKPKTAEKALEAELIGWLHNYGVQADNQISTSRHRMDIWIPGVCFLELKRSKVSGDDVCQAIDYCAEYQKPVVLVGNHISEMASRGIEAFNKAVSSEMIVFVSWSGVRTYLKGLLSL